MASETRGTVVLALSVNLGVGVAKGVAGLVTGSTALLAEAAHSVADTLNEVFLLASLSRSERPADARHPFGYGKERFFWSLLAAVGIFVSGALFSFYQGVTAILGGGGEERSTSQYLVIYAVLAVALVLEGISLNKAVRQVRAEAATARRGLRAFIVRSPDPTVKTVASEDTVAVLGVVVAFVGTLLDQVTGSEVFDGLASIVIGLLLTYVAYALGRDTKDLLIGEAADPRVRLTAYSILTSYPEIAGVQEMLTMQLGPDSVLVAARVQFVDGIDAGRVEEVSTRVEDEMRSRLPELRQVFLDPSRVRDEDRDRLAERLQQTVEEVRELDGDEIIQDLREQRDRSRGR